MNQKLSYSNVYSNFLLYENNKAERRPEFFLKIRRTDKAERLIPPYRREGSVFTLTLTATHTRQSRQAATIPTARYGNQLLTVCIQFITCVSHDYTCACIHPLTNTQAAAHQHARCQLYFIITTPTNRISINFHYSNLDLVCRQPSQNAIKKLRFSRCGPSKRCVPFISFLRVV